MIGILTISKEDSDKVTLLFHKYEKPLLYFIFTITKDWHEAEDILQTTFYKIIQNIRKVADADSAKTRKYLYTIARNEAINYYRANQKHLQTVVAYDDNMFIDNPQNDTEVIAKASLAELEMAIAGLRNSDREIIVLKYKMNFSDAEIADILGIRNDAARKRLSRARERIVSTISKGRSSEEDE